MKTISKFNYSFNNFHILFKNFNFGPKPIKTEQKRRINFQNRKKPLKTCKNQIKLWKIKNYPIATEKCENKQDSLKVQLFP